MISSTVATIFQEFLRANERSVFWDEDRKKNLDPFLGAATDFWGMDWDTKVRLCDMPTTTESIHNALDFVTAQNTPPAGGIAAVPQLRDQESHRPRVGRHSQ